MIKRALCMSSCDLDITWELTTVEITDAVYHALAPLIHPQCNLKLSTDRCSHLPFNMQRFVTHFSERCSCYLMEIIRTATSVLSLTISAGIKGGYNCIDTCLADLCKSPTLSIQIHAHNDMLGTRHLDQWDQQQGHQSMLLES